MTPEFPPNNPRAELEARLTAFILGELPAHEAAALRQTIDDDAELAALYDRLNAAHKLVREAVASPVEPAKESAAPLRLSEARRQKLLAQFKTVAPAEFVPSKKREINIWHSALQIAAVLAIVGLLAALAVPNFVKTRTTSQANSVINNLRQIDGAKQQWALETHAPPDAEPKASDIQPYLGRGKNGSFPQPIVGENYKIGKLNESPAAEFSPKSALGKRQRRISLDDGEEATAKIVSPLRAPAAVPEEAQAHDLERFYAQRTPQPGGNSAQAVSPPPPAKTTIVLPPMDNSSSGDVSLTWKTKDGSTQPPVVLGDVPVVDGHPSPGGTGGASGSPMGFFSRFAKGTTGASSASESVPAAKSSQFTVDELNAIGATVTNGLPAGGIDPATGLWVGPPAPGAIDPATGLPVPHFEVNGWSGKYSDYANAAESNKAQTPTLAGRPSVGDGIRFVTSATNSYVAGNATLSFDSQPYATSENEVTVSGGATGGSSVPHASGTGNLGVSGANSHAVTNSISTSPYSLGLAANNNWNAQSGDSDWNGFLEHPEQRQDIGAPSNLGDALKAKSPVSSSASIRGYYDDAYNTEGVSGPNGPAPDVNVRAKFADVTQQDNRALGFNWKTDKSNLGPNVVASGGTQPSFHGVQNGVNSPIVRQQQGVDNADGFNANPVAMNPDGAFPVQRAPVAAGIAAASTVQSEAEVRRGKLESPRAGGASSGSSMRQDPLLIADDGQNFTYTVVDGKLVPTPAPNNDFHFGTVPYVTGTYFGGINGQAASQYAYVPADKVPRPEVATEGGRVSKAESPRAAESRQYLSIYNEVIQNSQPFVETTPKSEVNPAQPQPGAGPAEASREIAGNSGNLGGSRELVAVRSLNTPELASEQPQPIAEPVDGWTTKVHNNAGNIGIADGSVQQATVNGFRSFANHTGDPNTSANGLVFPGDEPKTDTNVESVHVVGYVNLEGVGKKEAASSPDSVSTNDAFLSAGQRTSGFADRLKSLGLKSAGIGSTGQAASISTTFDDSVQPPVVAALPKTPTDKVPRLGDLPLLGMLGRPDNNSNTTAEPILHAGEIDFPDVSVNELLDVYGKLTGRNIVASPNLPAARITLTTTSDLTESEAKQAIESVLAMNGVSVVNVGTNAAKAVPMATVGTLGSSFSTNATSHGNVTVSVDPETKRVFRITDAATPLLVSTNYVTNSGYLPAQYAKASDISEALKNLDADKVKDGHSQAYHEKLAELQRLRRFQEILALRTAQESVELKMPTTKMVEVIEHADGKPSQNLGLGQRIGRMFTGKETQTARIKVERDVTDVPGVRGQPIMSGVYDPYFVQTEFEVIQSEKILDRVIDKLDLDKTWAAQKGSTVPLTKADTRALLKKNLEVAPAKNTSLINITVKSDKPEEAAKIANTIAEVYQEYRKQQREELIEGGTKAAKIELAQQQKKIAQVEDELDVLRKSEKVVDEDVPVLKHSTNAPIPQPEISAAENAFSTFSLNISDVSLKLAAASLEKGQMPDAATIRSEEFINAFDYRDPEPAPGAPLGFAWERAQYPFAHNRDLLRFAVKTAATGREPGRPLNIVLLLDKSGSMERADRVRIIHEALRVLATQLQPQDKISVVTFARVARLWVDGLSGSQAAEVADGLDKLTPEGGTNLEEAMRLAYETARRHYLANGVNRVVLLTDGAANLGNVDPDALKVKAEEHRKEGIALDCFGVGWEGYNDDLLEVLSRNGGGRYGFINTPEEAATDFVGQLAGALNVAAYDVKVQVEFNPKRVTNWRQIGYAKHQLTKEQFRDNSVKAAQIAAAESGNGLYAIEVNPNGEGPVATVRVRYRVPGTEDYPEHEYQVPYTGGALPLEQSSPPMRLMGSASAFSEWLASSPFAGEVTTDKLLGLMSGVPETYGADQRPKKLEWMIRQAKSLEGK